MGVLILVVFLLVIMPALLYYVAWAANRYTTKTPVWLNFPPHAKSPGREHR